MRLAPLALVSLVACGSKTAPPDAAPVAPPPTAVPTTAAPTTAAPTMAPAAEDAAAPPAAEDAAAPPAAEDAAAPPAAEDAAAPGEPPAPPPPAALPAPVAVQGECIPDPSAGPRFDWTEVVDGKLRFCRWSGMTEGPAPECWALDVAAKTLAKAEVDPELARLAKGGEWQRTWPEGLKVEAEAKKVTWCPPQGECHALDVGEAGVGQAAARGDHLLVAPPADLGTEAKSMSGLVFDGSGKKIATIPLTTAEEPGCPDVAWAGSSVWVTVGVCAGPGAVGWLADPVTGARRAWFGGGDKDGAWSAYGVVPVMVAEEVAAFREQYGNRVVFHDTKTGALIRAVDLRASQGKDPDTGEWGSGDPEEGAMELVGQTLAVVQGGGARGTIVLLEAATGKVTDVLQLQACKE